MTDAPDRIWAIHARSPTIYASGNTPVLAQDGPFSHYGYGEAHEYLRRDGETVRALVEALGDAKCAFDWAAQKMKGNCAGRDVNAVLLAARRTKEALAALKMRGASDAS